MTERRVCPDCPHAPHYVGSFDAPAIGRPDRVSWRAYRGRRPGGYVSLSARLGPLYLRGRAYAEGDGEVTLTIAGRVAVTGGIREWSAPLRLSVYRLPSP